MILNNLSGDAFCRLEISRSTVLWNIYTKRNSWASWRLVFTTIRDPSKQPNPSPTFHILDGPFLMRTKVDALTNQRSTKLPPKSQHIPRKTTWVHLHFSWKKKRRRVEGGTINVGTLPQDIFLSLVLCGVSIQDGVYNSISIAVTLFRAHARLDALVLLFFLSFSFFGRKGDSIVKVSLSPRGSSLYCWIRVVWTLRVTQDETQDALRPYWGETYNALVFVMLKCVFWRKNWLLMMENTR